MIVKMKRLYVLTTKASANETIETLKDLGVLHIDGTIHNESPALQEVKEALERANKALNLLPEATFGTQTDATPEEILKVATELENCENEVATIQSKIDKYLPFGNFSLDSFRELENKGIKMQLFASRKLPKGDYIKTITADRKSKIIYGIAIGKNEIAENEKVPLPEMSLADMEKKLNQTLIKKRQCEQRLSAFATSRPSILQTIKERTIANTTENAKASMGSQDGVKWITGFIPQDDIPRIKEAATQNGWGFFARDVKDDENPPTLIRPPKIFRPICTLFEMLDVVPGYREADISVVFYSFFTIFFAMLVGDAGYGLLYLILTIILRRKFKKAPSAPFTLLTVFSTATIIWGIISATYFGIPQIALPSFLKLPSATWIGDQNNIIQLCFTLGAIHLSIARIWNACTLFPSKKFLAEIGWVGIIWTMYSTSCFVIVSDFTFPTFMIPVAIISVLLIALFMLDRSELKENGVQLGMLPLNIISGLGDIISYVRLYAVGLSSVQLAENFNTMATGLPMPLFAKIPLMIIILLVGHGMNIAMGVLSILVHAVRLNTLEFSNYKGVTWSGYAYKPLSKK